jgi:PTS system nitrogen regulatory IIA component
MMNIVSRSLSRDDVVLGLDVPDKLRALEEAALIVERNHDIDHLPVLRALWRREQIGSTALGHGIAVPHARIAGLGEPIALLVRAKVPIKFSAPDGQPVSVLFVILVPEHADAEHLQILGAVSEMFADETFRKRLGSATEPAAIQRLFGEWNVPSH